MTLSDASAYPGGKWPREGNHRWLQGLTAPQGGCEEAPSQSVCVQRGDSTGRKKGTKVRGAINKEGKSEPFQINSQPESSRQNAWMIRKRPTEDPEEMCEGWGLNPSLHRAPVNWPVWWVSKSEYISRSKSMSGGEKKRLENH